MRGRKLAVDLIAPGASTRDAEGRWTTADDTTTVVAHVAPAANAVGRQGQDAREVPGRGERDDGVVLLPHGTVVDNTYQVDVSGAWVIPDGRYRIRAITRTVKHVRAALVKVEP